VTEAGFAVDCDAALVATLADETQFERNPDESTANYWKRQRKLLAAVASPQSSALTLQITYEFHSEQPVASAKEGERLVISADGVVTIAKIAPAAKPVRATDGLSATAKPKRPPVKTADKSPEKPDPKKR
jgi:antitoxin (DNA-binding transcriptional repressor) of toxin-antitoxin stability system